MPSVSHRGTRWFDICSVMTCASSCHSVASHWNSPGPRPRRIHRDDAAEAGAERADHARAGRRCAPRSRRASGKISIRIGPLRRELVALRAACRAPGARAASRTPAAPALRPCASAARRRRRCDGDELVERVHHLQQVVGDDVERIDLERRFERGARAGSSPVRSRWMPRSAERCAGSAASSASARRVSADRLVEPVVVRGQLAGDAVHLAVASARSPAPCATSASNSCVLVLDVGERRRAARAPRGSTG